MKLTDCHNVSDLRKLAKRNLPWPVFNYLDGGADDELTLNWNTTAFNDYELLPSQLNDISNIELSTTVLGQKIDWPVIISPTGASRLFHHDAETAVVRATNKFGTIYSLSTLGTTTIEDVAADYDAICLTVDTQVAGNRERDLVTGFGIPPKFNMRSILSYARHLPWTIRAILKPGFDMVNVLSSPGVSSEIDEGVIEYINSQFDRTLNWKDVEWLAGQWGGPLVIKGIQTLGDARKAVDSGATAVMLSNHGGRQLETAPAPVDCIAPIADELRDKLEIICDGGVRRGTHVVKALALGANVCSIGRGYLFGLAAGGQRGVEHALGLLKDEIERTMGLLGCNSVHKLDDSYIRRRGNLTG